MYIKGFHQKIGPEKLFETEMISIACARYNLITDLYLRKAIKSLSIILNSNIAITFLTIVCLCM